MNAIQWQPGPEGLVGHLPSSPGTSLFLIIGGGKSCRLNGSFIPDVVESRRRYSGHEEAKQAAENNLRRWCSEHRETVNRLANEWDEVKGKEVSDAP